MAYGEGWEVEVSEEFQDQLKTLAKNEDQLEERVEGLILVAYSGPDAIWPQQHMVANLWCTRIFAPAPYLVFYESDADDRPIELVIISEAP